MVSDGIKASYEQSHCYPSIYYPTNALHTADPAWATCIAPKFHPVFDPPRTLAAATAMVPAKTTNANHAGAAAPAATVDPPGVSKTAPPSQPSPKPANDPPANDPSNQDSPGEDPSSHNPQGNDLSAEDPPQDPQAKNPPVEDPDTSNPAGVDPPANSQVTPNDPVSSPVTAGPEVGVQPGHGNSKSPVSQPGPGFTLSIPGAPVMSGSFINPSSIVMADTIVAAGASAVQIQGHVMSLDPAASNVVIDGQAHALPKPDLLQWDNIDDVPAPPLLATTVDGHYIQAASTPGVILMDGQSVTRGADAITIANTPVALKSDGNLVIGTSTIQNLLPQSPSPGSIFSIAGLPVTALSNGVAIAQSTLIPGAQAITVAGTRVSLGFYGLIVGTSTIPLPTQPPPAMITAAGQTVTALPNGNVVVAGTTLNPNAPGITVSGTPISLGSNGLVVGTSTIAMPSSQSSISVNIGGHTVPVSFGTDEVVVAGTIIKKGQPPITIAGTTVAFGDDGLMIGTSTMTLPGATPTGDIGGFIFSGLNGGLPRPSTIQMGASNQTSSNSTGNNDPMTFLGSGAKLKASCSAFATCIFIIFLVLV